MMNLQGRSVLKKLSGSEVMGIPERPCVIPNARIFTSGRRDLP